MTYRHLANIMRSAFVRTPPERAQEIVFNLLAFSNPPNTKGLLTCNIYDPTCGEGDLLEPFLRLELGSALHLLGVEISADRADISRARLPGANIVTSAVEAMEVTRGSMSAVLANPPCYLEDSGQRAKYRIIADAGESLIPGSGIMVAVLSARSAWDNIMVNHWCRYYYDIRCWKFPDAETLDPQNEEGTFERYLQIVVVGIRREKPLSAPEPAEQTRLLGWRWRESRKAGISPWAQGCALPDLPNVPSENPYHVPPAVGMPMPTLVVKKSTE